MSGAAHMWNHWRDRIPVLDGLIAACAGKDYLQCKVTRKSSPKNWEKVRVLPGAYGRCVAELSKGTYLVDAKTADLLPALQKARQSVVDFLEEVDDEPKNEPGKDPDPDLGVYWR